MWSRGVVIIKGAGDMASGVAHKLFQCGFSVIMTDIAKPTCVRRTVSFANCIYEGIWEIEGVKAKNVNTMEDIQKALDERIIPVIIDPECKVKTQIDCKVLIDAILAKKNTGTKKGDAPLVIGLGPGFCAGEDVDAVVETNRGHYLGRVIWQGIAQPNTGIPGKIEGYGRERVVRAPIGGTMNHTKKIGDRVSKDEVISIMGDTEVRAAMDGVIRGLIYEEIVVPPGFKIGDIDPREAAEGWIDTISDKARCIAGGVLEAILTRQ